MGVMMRRTVMGPSLSKVIHAAPDRAVRDGGRGIALVEWMESELTG